MSYLTVVPTRSPTPTACSRVSQTSLRFVQPIKRPRYGPVTARPGFLSGALGKKMGLAVESTKTESGDRRYSVKG